MDIRAFTKRSLLPSVALGVLESKLSTRVRRRLARGTTTCAELYFAFDDPYSLFALRESEEMLRKRGVELALFPVLERGIAHDPVEHQRRAYALKDARRLALRRGWPFSRSAVVQPEHVRYITLLAEAARKHGKIREFSRELIERIYLGNGLVPDFGEVYARYGRLVGESPPTQVESLSPALAASARTMRRKGHWETPSLFVGGKWFFAHDRIEQAMDYLDELGI